MYFTNQYKDKKEYQDENGEFQPNLLPEDVKAQIRDLTAGIGAVIGGAVGDSSYNAQLAGVIGQNAVENNSFITTSSDGKKKYYTKEDDRFNLLQYLVATNQLDPSLVPDSIFKDLANDGTDVVSTDAGSVNNPSWQYYKEEFYKQINEENYIDSDKFNELMNKPELIGEIKQDIESKLFWDNVKKPFGQYVFPGLQMVGGAGQIGLSAAIDVVGCGTVVACVPAVAGSALLIGNGVDDVVTGWNNFGKLPENSTNSIFLKNLGISEETSGWIKLGTGVAGIGAELAIARQGLNSANTIPKLEFGNVSGSSKNQDEIWRIDPRLEPEANFAGSVLVRPKEGNTLINTSQVDIPLAKHLITGEVAGRKKQKLISGGHNSDNFYDVLNSNGGKVIGTPTQVSKGITEIKYQLPNGRVETKTIYDPKVYSDTQMASMANQAAAKAIVNYGVNGNKIQNISINGITFRVPINTQSGSPQVPTSFPVNPKSK